MSLTAAFLRETLKQHSGEALIVLLTLSGTGITTQRYAANAVSITSRGQTYTGYEFDSPLPSDSEDLEPSLTLNFSNIERRLIDEIRTVVGPMIVVLEAVTASDPNTVQMGPYEFEWTDSTWDDTAVRGTLKEDAFLDDAFPRATFSPQRNPGLHGRTT